MWAYRLSEVSASMKLAINQWSSQLILGSGTTTIYWGQNYKNQCIFNPKEKKSSECSITESVLIVFLSFLNQICSMCNLNIWVSFGCQLLITILSWNPGLYKWLQWAVLPTHSCVSCLRMTQVLFLSLFSMHGLCAVSSVAESLGNAALLAQFPGKSQFPVTTFP